MTDTEREKLISDMKSAKSADGLFAPLYEYVKNRLELPGGTKETDIYRLVLYSVRLKMPGEDVKTLESRLATVDCHQTSYIVSKKTLLMMEIEREIDVHISPEESEKAETLPLYADALWRRKNDGK